MFLIVLIIILILILFVLIILNVHTVLYIFCVQGYLLVPLSLGVLLSHCILYVY